MKMICAWCNKLMYETPSVSPTDSHGICNPCKEQVEKELNDRPREKKVDRTDSDAVGGRTRAPGNSNGAESATSNLSPSVL